MIISEQGQANIICALRSIDTPLDASSSLADGATEMVDLKD